MKCLSDYLWQSLVPLIFFSFVWILFKYLEREDELQKAQQERTAMELKFLKSQMNPHVLFNNLNTIYSYAIEKPDETPDLILKLSDNLKHVLYESNADFIPLENELQYVTNYIDFQRIRIEGVKKLNYTSTINNTNYQIAPLLLIAIIENAFKHSTPNSTITISIFQEDSNIICFCENEYDAAKISESTNIGLQNLEKRLHLLYEDKYSLQIKTDATFSVTLKLNLV
ncbi:sensor histidine kinase [Tenacibaculum agarivorans]|uniref:sensor histidine kinase n=1 Tax=Tenacibaculum agarivorans TaxID=1908389 RepID=UPI001F1612D9|nr:histidine kinase [Tenacibaculum agarivorans]